MASTARKRKREEAASCSEDELDKEPTTKRRRAPWFPRPRRRSEIAAAKRLNGLRKQHLAAAKAEKELNDVESNRPPAEASPEQVNLWQDGVSKAGAAYAKARARAATAPKAFANAARKLTGILCRPPLPAPAAAVQRWAQRHARARERIEATGRPEHLVRPIAFAEVEAQRVRMMEDEAYRHEKRSTVARRVAREARARAGRRREAARAQGVVRSEDEWRIIEDARANCVEDPVAFARAPLTSLPWQDPHSCTAPGCKFSARWTLGHGHHEFCYDHDVDGAASPTGLPCNHPECFPRNALVGSDFCAQHQASVVADELDRAQFTRPGLLPLPLTPPRGPLGMMRQLELDGYEDDPSLGDVGGVVSDEVFFAGFTSTDDPGPHPPREDHPEALRDDPATPATRKQGRLCMAQGCRPKAVPGMQVCWRHTNVTTYDPGELYDCSVENCVHGALPPGTLCEMHRSGAPWKVPAKVLRHQMAFLDSFEGAFDVTLERQRLVDGMVVGTEFMPLPGRTLRVDGYLRDGLRHPTIPAKWIFPPCTIVEFNGCGPHAHETCVDSTGPDASTTRARERVRTLELLASGYTVYRAWACTPQHIERHAPPPRHPNTAQDVHVQRADGTVLAYLNPCVPLASEEGLAGKVNHSRP
jgi:hypothetical protein